MDPVSQGTFGALFAQTISNKKDLAKAALIGLCAGMAPDLDILIRSSEDSLLALQYHRHFTHSLFFIPFGALLCSLVLHPTLGRLLKTKFKQTFLWCLIAVATHGLLDSATSYGTLLFWPFTDMRVAWDLISIVDPLITLPLIVCVISAAIFKKKNILYAGLIWIVFYFSLSYMQQQKALNLGNTLAVERNLGVTNIDAKPSFANILIWKVITTTNDRYYVDAVKVGFGDPVSWEGDTIEKLDVVKDLPWLDDDSQQSKDIERFRWFSQGYIALDKDDPYRIIDIRYSLLPQQIKPLWGIKLSPNAQKEDHVEYYSARNEPENAAQTLWQMLWE